LRTNVGLSTDWQQDGRDLLVCITSAGMSRYVDDMVYPRRFVSAVCMPCDCLFGLFLLNYLPKLPSYFIYFPLPLISVLLPPPKKEVIFWCGLFVCFSVCLSVCPSDYLQTCERILTKFLEG